MNGLIYRGCIWMLVVWLVSGVFCGASSASAEALSGESVKRLIVRVQAGNHPGAGIIFSVRGGYLFIATAYHVVENLPPGRTAEVEFEFLRGIPVQIRSVYRSYPKFDLAVLRINIAESPLRDVRIGPLPFDCFCDTPTLKRGDKVYPVGHPEGELWDVPVIPAQIKRVVAEEISLQPRCFPGHSGGGLFDEQWRLAGMLTRTSGNTCEAVGFWRICATLEDDWGLVVNREPRELQNPPIFPTPFPVTQPTSTPIPAPEQAKEWTDPVTGIEFVWIPPGCFQMGQTKTDEQYLLQTINGNYKSELPRHNVCIQEGFWMGKYEVTQAQWQHIMGRNPSYFTTEKVGQNSENHPVENVSWDTVQEFIQKASMKAGTTRYRLPSETEWEYAVRAGTETMFSFGNDAKKLNEYAWYRENSGGTTHPVGQLKPNAWGLYDMHGNVWEWCEDVWHDSYHGAPSDGSVWQLDGDVSYNVLRGGSWDYNPRNLRSAVRAGLGHDGRNLVGGFRLCVAAGGVQ